MSRILRRPMFRGGRVDSRGTGITSGLSYAKGGSVNTPKRGLVDGPGGYNGWKPPVDAGLLTQADKVQNWLTPKYLEKQFRKHYYLDEDQIDYIPDPAMMGMQGMTTTMYGGQPDIIEGSKFDITRNQILENPGNYDFHFNKWVADNYGKQITRQGEILEAVGDKDTQLFTPRKLPNETEGGPEEGETPEEFEARIRRESAEELQALIKSQTDKDPLEEIEKKKEMFKKAYGSGVADDASTMALSLAGKMLKPEATVKSGFGEFFEEESKRPSESKKYKDAATTAAINAYLTGEKTLADFEKALKLNRAKLSDQISMTRGMKDWQDYLKEGTGTGDKKTSMGSMIYAVEKMNEAGKIDSIWGGPLPDEPSQYQEGLVYVQENPDGGKLLVEWDGEKLFTHTPVYK